MSKNLKLSKSKIGVAVLIIFSIYLWWRVTSPQFLDEQKEVVVEKGSNFLEIARSLKSAGVIKSRLSFIISALYRGSFATLKAGQYVFEPGLNLHQILSRIEKGEALFGSDEVVVTISEGLTLDDMIAKLEKAGFDDAEALSGIKASSLIDEFDWLKAASSKHNTLEGFLFPDTYRFSKDAGAYEIMAKMLNRFGSRTAELRKSVLASGRNFYEIVITASILEKEVPPNDMPLAAGVLWKRLEIGMPLQADATLVYDLGRPIKRSDTTSLDSPYNTYKYQGLPPTPISNPGLVALNAALYPQESNYLYYLSKPASGETVFSATLDEHNLAKAKYLNN